MWAELAPDVYDGPKCDQVKPQWRVVAEGDKDGPDDQQELQLNCRHFPPGTKVTVSVPCCPNPKCGMSIKIFGFDPPRTDEDEWKVGKCESGFDWKDWMEGQYT